MGRKKISKRLKKDRLSITITKENFDKFKEYNLKNKSKIIEGLLTKYFEKEK